MKLSNKKFIIKLDGYYYSGQDEDIKTEKGLGTGALGSASSLPVFDKVNIVTVNDTMSLRTRIVEIIDALRYQDIFENEDIKKLTIEFIEDVGDLVDNARMVTLKGNFTDKGRKYLAK